MSGASQQTPSLKSPGLHSPLTLCNPFPTMPPTLSCAFDRAIASQHRRRALRLGPQPRRGDRLVAHIGNLFGRSAQPAYPGTERGEAVQPRCEVVRESEGFQLRFYPPFICASVAYEKRDEGFLALGEYLGGANAEGIKLVQTQPVFLTIRPGPGGKGDLEKTMSVFVPSVVPSPDGGFRELGQPPAPQGADGVRLEVLGGCAVAVAVVEGNVTQGVAESARARLVRAVESAGLRLAEEAQAGQYQVLQYGPLFSLKTRANEIMVRVPL